MDRLYITFWEEEHLTEFNTLTGLECAKDTFSVTLPDNIYKTRTPRVYKVTEYLTKQKQIWEEDGDMIEHSYEPYEEHYCRILINASKEYLKTEFLPKLKLEKKVMMTKNPTSNTFRMCYPHKYYKSPMMVKKITGNGPKPKYPLFIVSKRRYKYNYTSKSLNEMGIDHYIIVEEEEYENYRNTKVPTATLLILPKTYQTDYDTLDNLGDTITKGAGPARNFAWDYSIASGFKKHWMLDDNILGFFMLKNLVRFRCYNPSFFTMIEDFTDKYKNIGLSGCQYKMFIIDRNINPPFTLNKKISGVILIDNDLPFRWTGRYNEDIILSIKALENRYCTFTSNICLSNKMWTRQLRGGNTDELYKNGTEMKTDFLVNVYPKYCKKVIRYQRPHHALKFSKYFTHQLEKNPEITPTKKDHDMRLTEV